MQFGPCAKLADVDSMQAGRALQVIMDLHRKKERPIDSTAHEDYQHILDDKSIDVVVIGSPDHWHTKQLIDSLNAGKDVYCEKPLTLTIEEGRLIEEAIKKTGRVVQVGTQQRTEMDSRFATAAAMLREGRIGDVSKLTVCIGGSRESGLIPVVDPPKHLNWEKWLGQAPMVDYRSVAEISDTAGWGAGHPFSRAHRYYRWFYEYSGGKLTDWGAHHVDIAMLALDKLNDEIGLVKIDPKSVTHPVEFKDGMPVQADRFNAATKFHVEITFADGVVMDVRDDATKDKGFSNGIMFEGTKGRYLVNRGKLVGSPVDTLKSNPLTNDPFETLYSQSKPKSHMGNFFDCIKSRKQPISDVASHNRMLNICHAINIAMRLNRTLTYDPKTQKFVDDDQANTFVSRPQRTGYEISV
jgi:predicted dehydrogenase